MTVVIGFRVGDKLKKVILKEALKENRSISNFIKTAVLTYLKEHKDIDILKDKKK